MRKKTFLPQLIFFFIIVLTFSSVHTSCAAGGAEYDSLKNSFFRIQVIDEQTGRGVPLVTLTTTNNLSFITDSNGIVALYEPGLMNQKVFFTVSSHGYEFPKDGFGFSGTAVDVKPGSTVTLKIKRLNIAERLYRLTGQGIYRDSMITSDPVPLANPVINGLVMGQDSVQTCWYNDRLYWFWGDTGRVSYPLGNFSASGAVSVLPEDGGLDPSVGVDLKYFVDETGFSKKMAPMTEHGLIWLDGIINVNDSSGSQRMVAKYTRLKDLGHVLERGLMVFNDQKDQFELIVRGGPHFLPYDDSGHSILISSGKDQYYYFAIPFPVSVRMRVRTLWENVIDPSLYEVFTSLDSPKADSATSSDGSLYRWISCGELLKDSSRQMSDLIAELKKHQQDTTFLIDIVTGKRVIPHGGSVYWNQYRQKWIQIAVQSGGESSFLGEVWYAEADTPLGPWAYARKVVTHDKYSFYNPKHHPYFDGENGRLIYFEGTYTQTFSGRPEDATPRYDYNQIMYRLDLSEKRLALPEPVYEVSTETDDVEYLTGREIRRTSAHSRIEKVAFYAFAPARKHEGLVPIYTQKETFSRKTLTKTPSSDSAKPLFYALIDQSSVRPDAPCVLPLFEYTNKKTSAKIYSVDEMPKKTFKKSEEPLCYVWKNPAELILADWPAQPCENYD